MIKKALFIALFTPFYSFSFLGNLVSDLGKIVQGLDQMNAANRKVVYDLFSPQKENNNDTDPSENNVPPRTTRSFFNLNQSDNQETTEFTFKDLAGSIPEDVREVVDFLRNAHHFLAVGAQMPKGVLLVGPPGTGKTSIARAIAGEAQAHFFNATGSEFIEVYVGVGPQRIRELFDKARSAIKRGTYTKAVIFIDEIDAIGGSRNNDSGGGSSEYRNTLNELLNQMDGFKQDGSILVIGATNTPDSLDQALKRPGRFDRIVEIPLPSMLDREEILRLYATKVACATGIDFKEIAQKTINFSGAELKNLVNEAAVRAARKKEKLIKQEHFDTAARDLIKRKNREHKN